LYPHRQFLFENRLNIDYKKHLFYQTGKKMHKQDFCQNCKQSHLCREVYEHLGKTQSPSVAFKVLCGFLLPLVVFIASLVGFEKILARATAMEDLQTALGVLSALAVTFVWILITKGVIKRIDKYQQQAES
jgi:hypothetical protein